MNAVTDRVGRRGMVRVLLAAAFLAPLHACSSEVNGSGNSETNWVASCDDDADCTVGACVCGVCSKSCTTDSACPGGSGPTVCAMGESNAYHMVCGQQNLAPGVCLRDCSTTGCNAGFRCESGACVPSAVSVPDGGAPQNIETYTSHVERMTYLNGSVPTPALFGRCLGGTLSRNLKVESQCTVVEHRLDGEACDCAADGLQVPSSEVLTRTRTFLERIRRCGGTTGVPCESLCGCQAPVLSGNELQVCLNDPEVELTAGYCIVAPDSGRGAPALIESCPVQDRTLFRYFTGLRSMDIVISCSTVHTADVDIPSAAGAVGDECTPADEYRADFSGYDPSAVVVEKGNAQCGSGNVCLVNRFRGRTNCAYGQPEPPEPSLEACTARGSNDPVTVSVPPQKTNRPPDSAVYCSCRCDGPGPGPFCECPSDFTCTPLLDDGAPGQVAGSYCVKAGTAVEDPNDVAVSEDCSTPVAPRDQGGCGDP